MTNQRTSERDTLLLAPGELVRVAGREWLDPNEVQSLVNSLRPSSTYSLHGSQHELQVLPDGLVLVCVSRLSDTPHEGHDRRRHCLFLSSQSIGSHSSTLLPSGSRIQANLPFSADSGPFTGSIPFALSCASMPSSESTR